MKFFKTILTITMLLAVTATASLAGNARLQVIHNAADPAAETVDVYVNGDLLLNDFAFRKATPFVEVPAGVELNIGVAPGNSLSADDIIASFPVTLEVNETYVAIANGVLDPNNFSDNPDGRDIAFNIFPRDNIRQKARWGYFVNFIAFHGATDAPTVDVRVKGWPYGALVDGLTYSEFSNYGTVLPLKYVLEVTPGNDKSTVVASFEADLRGLRGGAAVIFASGFLSPESGQPGFGLFAALPDGTVVEFPMLDSKARLQVIHNAADPAAEVVDIYVNGNLFQNDFTFRTATPFIDVPAGVELNIGVAPGNSSSASDVIANFPVTFEGNKTYVVMANGVLDPGAFSDNPDGRDIGFTIFARDDGREKARRFYYVDISVFHGATDAPTVDVVVQNNERTILVDDAAYGDFTDYLKLWPKEYYLDITSGNDNSTVVATFQADLSGLRGGAATVFASGFLNPAENQAVFGLFAALPNGDVVELPRITSSARLQVIHNAADPAADVVDIYVNGDLFQNDFAFRTATPFVDVPAGVELNIGVAPGNSSSADDIIASFPVTFENRKTYIAIANGVLNPGDFNSNPDGRNIGFTIFAKDDIQEQARWGSLVDLIVFHGATDAPAVDVLVRNWYNYRLIDDLTYGDFSKYRHLWASSYTLDITPAGDNGTVVASFQADLQGLKGGAAVVFASGFLVPADENQPAFGLYAALPNGQVVELPAANKNMPSLAAKETADLNLPDQFGLNQNYPNPFNPSTIISFNLPTAANVNLTVYNLLGQQVTTLVNESISAGQHQVEFNASNLASGIYFYKLDAGSFSDTKKMILLK
ncbi:MAG: DUF4397 domain-containing protein [candidate division Zixibacteria bacterium]|nr:DUF4397 domain-containing protein [candidate division Zixibacteria bacterium]